MTFSSSTCKLGCDVQNEDMNFKIKRLFSYQNPQECTTYHTTLLSMSFYTEHLISDT